ncbi:MAG: DNA-directed RNA polymerase subunit omega [Holosporaceae bacterium]|jgi:DNA-directed RNA polymerase subunit omega|nr:DNA-directed RNA polymerase subunit omega [Holosporaceae bacterium]
MARITTEDCENVVANRFDLVILAARRARQIFNGEVTTLGNKDEKKPVIALREIAAQSVSVDTLKENVIKSFRTLTPEEDFDDDIEDMPEEDTYNPYNSADVASLEVGNSSPIDEKEKLANNLNLKMR